MLNQPYGGNPYRGYCLECEKFLPAISKEEWKNHATPYVLPRDAPKDEPESIIPLEEWDEAERYQQVLKRIENYREGREQETATDGGVVVDQDDHDDRDDQDDQDDQDENKFVCPDPDCDETHSGQPDKCDNCGAIYDW